LSFHLLLLATLLVSSQHKLSIDPARLQHLAAWLLAQT
jgi:hypothetical protein